MYSVSKIKLCCRKRPLFGEKDGICLRECYRLIWNKNWPFRIYIAGFSFYWKYQFKVCGTLYITNDSLKAGTSVGKANISKVAFCKFSSNTNLQEIFSQNVSKLWKKSFISVTELCFQVKQSWKLVVYVKLVQRTFYRFC